VSQTNNTQDPATPSVQVTASHNKFQEILPEKLDESYDDYEVIQAATPRSFNSVTATPRSFNSRRGQGGRRKQEQLVQLDAVTINSTPGNFRIIQPIQIVSTVSPPRSLRYILNTS
jgi:hypothetical protein